MIASHSEDPPGNRHVMRRFAFFLLSSVLGMLVGISGDLLGPTRFDSDDLAAALMFSPILVTLGGGRVTIPWARGFCLFGGLGFLPVFILLCVMCIRKPRIWTYVAAFLWAMQGFFQLCHRLPLMMAI